MNFKSSLNMHALQSLLKPVERPAQNLCVANDEKHSSIPLLIFTEQHLPTPNPDMQPLNQLPYEDVQKPGSNGVLSLDDFETQNFYMGHPFGGEI